VELCDWGDNRDVGSWIREGQEADQEPQYCVL
jgi:hypothetical protein